MNTSLIAPDLTPEQAQQFERYFELLTEWNKVMNLTAIVDPDEAAVKHFADSLTVLRFIDPCGAEGGAEAGTAQEARGTKRLIDVGTGAGFPGIPLKIMRPELEVTLLDSLEKRVRFLNCVINELGLTGIRAVHMRAEDAGRRPEFRDRFEFAVARAVAPMNVLCEYCLPFVRPGGLFIAMKGPGQENYGRALDRLCGETVAEVTFQLGAAGEAAARPGEAAWEAAQPGEAVGEAANAVGVGDNAAASVDTVNNAAASVDAGANAAVSVDTGTNIPDSNASDNTRTGITRRLICIKKTLPTPRQYPRKAGTPAKKPL